jgi:hypothetical protein
VVADGPDFVHTARQATNHSADDGQPIASLRLTPDGNTALHALGSVLNEALENAIPENWTKGAKQQVFALKVDGKNAPPRLLGEMGCPEEDCEDIEISPDGKWAAVREKEVVAVQCGWQTGKGTRFGAWSGGSTQMVARWQTHSLRQPARRS